MIMTIVNTLAFAVMIVVNVLANTGKLGGLTTGGVSAQYNNLLTPAGWTFSIWGIIYALLLIFIVASYFNSSAKMITNALGHWFWISCALNVLWLICWHYNLIELSMAVMIALLGTLIAINKSLSPTSNLFTAAFSVYLGWITIAMLANLTTLFVSFGMVGTGNTSQLWTTAVLPLAALIIAIVVFFKADWIYGLATIFAYSGIVYRQIAPSGLNAKYTSVLVSSIVGLAIITLVTIFVIANIKRVPRIVTFKE